MRQKGFSYLFTIFIALGILVLVNTLFKESFDIRERASSGDTTSRLVKSLNPYVSPPLSYLETVDQAPTVQEPPAAPSGLLTIIKTDIIQFLGVVDNYIKSFE